jgi:hypothetical protein
MKLLYESHGVSGAQTCTKAFSKSTHEHELNEGEYKDFNRDGIERVFHTNSMRCDVNVLFLAASRSCLSRKDDERIGCANHVLSRRLVKSL